MEITGRSTADVDTIVWEDDYFEDGAIARFVARLEGTREAEQFLFRESEFDCAFRQVDMRIADLTTAGESDSSEMAVARTLRDEVWEGHEQVGEHNAERAAMAWRRMAILLQEGST
ncbi:hypothetical protein [Pseudonocardia sp. GCM10023141]|uniref:hypothetical protein n=1 Tax=Pseudonocardia sp. GCM10023141 TaxID=3252653 RepID=UPI00360B2F1A